MTTLLTAAKALIALVAAGGFIIFWAKKKIWTRSLEVSSKKAQETGDTSDVEAIFNSTPPESK